MRLCRRKALGLSEDIKLLPRSDADAAAAQVVLTQQAGVKFQDNWQNKRQKIMTESIFGAASPPGQQLPTSRDSSSRRRGLGSSSQSQLQKQQLPSRRSGLAALASSAGSGSSRASAVQKEQLQQRVLLAKRKKQA